MEKQFHLILSNTVNPYSSIMKLCTTVPCPYVISVRGCRQNERGKAILERRGIPVHGHSFRLFKVGFRVCLEVSLEETVKQFIREKKEREVKRIRKESNEEHN